MIDSQKYRVGENKYLYNGKELQDESLGGVNLDLYDYGARYYDPQIARWTTQDPMVEAHQNYTPYAYVYNNPIGLLDPFGLDSIYAKNFWGKVNYIGNDGKTDGNAYIVKGAVKRGVKNATENGMDFSGSLTESDLVAKVPQEGVMSDVISSVDATNKSQKENGGSSNTGDANATRWDEGAPAQEVKDAQGNVTGAKATINPFVIGGTQSIPTDASQVENYWHVHPNTTVGGVSLGSSTPSDADKSFQANMQNRGYKGNAFVIGARSNTVTFYNSRKSILTIKYSDFRRIGGK